MYSNNQTGGYPQTGNLDQTAYPPIGSQYNTQYSEPTVPPPSYSTAVDTPPAKASTSRHVQPSEEFNDGFAGGSFGLSFSDKAIRHAFIRKVYLILVVQLLVTFGFVCLFSLVLPIKSWIQKDGLWFYILAYVLFLVTYIVLVCIPSVRRNFPGNFICLAIFTLAFSYLVGTISSFHDTDIVFVAAGVTCLVCFAISLFAIQTKIDFTMCSGLLFALVMVLILFGFSCMIFYLIFPANIFAYRIMDCVYGGLAALVFSLYYSSYICPPLKLFLVYDTQMVVGGRKHELSPEEYVTGALQLYMDVVMLFLILLSLFGKGNN